MIIRIVNCPQVYEIPTDGILYLPNSRWYLLNIGYGLSNS